MPRGPLAGAAGPGKFSVRTDGMSLPSASYGEGVETQAIKSGAPLSKTPDVRGATNTDVRAAAAQAPVTPLFAPTQRPTEPITTGIALGEGAGPEVLGMRPMVQEKLSDILAKMLPFDQTGEIGILYQKALSRGMQMPNPNIQSAAIQAGLTPTQQSQINGLSKLLDSHKQLLALPAPQAQAKFSQLTQDQQNAHVALFGGDQQQDRGWLGNALHYMTDTAKTVIAAPFKALNEVSDFMTRLYRTGAIALDQGVNLNKAFEIANDKGDKVFSPGRIANAKSKYGSDMINVAMKVAQGISIDEIIASGTDAEKQIASRAAQKKDPLFQDALDSVQAAKYSPGRAVANLLLPGFLEGSGFLYKGISGIGDAAYRIFADPTLFLGKAKKAYDAGNFALMTMIGKDTGTYGRSILRTAGDTQQVERVFRNGKIVDFWNVYGAQLDKLGAARAANDVRAGAEAATQLRRIAPEFGPSAIEEFMRAGVKNAATAKNYLANAEDVRFILRGQAARKTPLIPQLDASRKLRIAALTTGDKVLNIDRVGRALTAAAYGADEIQYGDIATGLFQNAEQIAKLERGVGKIRQDGSFRLSLNQIQGRLDRFARKFTVTPYFKNNFFDVNEIDAAKKIYQLARVTNTRYHSKIIQEAFAAGDEGQKRQIFLGLWNTYAEIRQISKGEAGLDYLVAQNGKIPQQYATNKIIREVDDAGNEIIKTENPAVFGTGQAMAIDDGQLSSAIAVPSLYDMDLLAAKQTLIGRMFGNNYKKWATKLTDYWTFGTIAGPRFPVRNAAEDLMLHLAVGDSPWGLVKSRFLSTKLQIAAGQNNLGFINKLVRRADVSKYQAEIKAAVAEGNVDSARRVMAKAVAESSLGAKLDKRSAELLARYIRNGDIDNLLADVAEGSKNAARGLDNYLKLNDDVSKYGKSAVFKVNEKLYKRKTGSTFLGVDPTQSTEGRVGWLVKLGMFGSSDLRRLTIKNISKDIDRETAISNIRKYLDDLPEKDRNRFQLYKAGGDTQQHATALYDDTRLYFSKFNGDLNEELLGKVRRINENGEIAVSTKELNLEDIPLTRDLAPTELSVPVIIPVSESENYAASIMDKGWDWMGEANARMSRHPLVIDSIINIQKEMEDSGFWKHYMDKMTAGKTGQKLIVAQKQAEKQLLGIAEDYAKERVLSFVDNPAVRSQLAVSVRNFARFYRATEDFYRRIYRTVRYNPEALTRASLTYEGIAHSGWVQTDDNGDQYFFYPGLEPVYKVMNKVGRLFGVQDAFQVPMPVEFSAKLKMITPSMNPDSLFPTFAGPLASVPIKMIGNVVPQVRDLESFLTGSYGEDQPLISAILPSHVNRALQAYSRDERNSQYASAFRKAVTYLEATGHGLEIKIDPKTGQEIPPTAGELAAYQDKVQAATATVLGLRFLFGFAAPASPQVTLKSDMAKWVRDNERTSYKQAFNKLIERYGSIDKATEEWIRLFPDQMPYTVSESQANTVAQVRAVTAAGNWVRDNKELLSKYPEGAAFLIPQAGSFDFNAYKLLFREGLKENRTLSEFIRKASSARDLQYYYQQKDAFDQQLAMTYSVDAKRVLRNQWQQWADQYRGARPFLQDEIGAGGQRQIERQRSLVDLRRMLDDKDVKVEPQLRGLLAQMVNTYDSFMTTRDTITSNSASQQTYKDMLKINVKAELQRLAQQNPNAQSAYDMLFARLLGDQPVAEMKSAPGPSDIGAWQKQIIKPGAVVGGTTTAAGVQNVANPAASALFNMTTQQRKQIALVLKNVGYKVPTSGTFSDALLNAYTTAVGAAQSQAMQTGQPFNDDFFKNYLARETQAYNEAQAAGGKKFDTVRQRQVLRPETIAATIDEVFSGVLGRAATDAEKKQYIDRIQKKMAKTANMQTTQYKDVGGGVQEVVSTEAFSPKQYLYDQISGTDEAKRQQVLGFYDAFKRTLGVS